MSDEFTTEQDGTPAAGGGLRAQLEAVLAERKKLAEELATLKSQEAERSVTATWQELQVPDAIRGLYQGEKSVDAIKAWWESAKSLFNIQAAEQANAESPEQEAQREELSAVQQAASIGNDTLNSGYSQFETKANALKNKSGVISQADVDDVLGSLGIPKF